VAERREGPLDSEAEITLGLLNAVHENSALTQRSIARELGIALGLANAYLKRCVKKGLIKVSQVPPNRYAYYLTPSGFAEKSRLTAQYFSDSFQFFRRARHQCGDLFAACARNGWRRVVLAGTGDLGEIATLCARDFDIAVVGFIDGGFARGAEERAQPESDPQFAGLPVVADPRAFADADAAIVTDLADPQGTFDALCSVFRAERVLAPPFLRVAAQGAPGGIEGGGA
jgi:DNA-binding MarR family transcriptional regulator